MRNAHPDRTRSRKNIPLKSHEKVYTTEYILIYNLNRINGHLYIHRRNFNYINESPFSVYPGVQGAMPLLIWLAFAEAAGEVQEG